MTPRTTLLIRLTFIGVLAVAAVLVLALVGPPSRAEVESWFAHAGLGAAVSFCALYAVVSLTPLPKPVFSLAAGALFGVPTGVLVVLVGATIGAVVSFWLGRLLGRDVVARMLGARAARFDELLRDRGFWAVVVVRLAPVVPFTAVNYLSGVTAIRPVAFVLGTVVGMLPGTTAYVTVGAYGSTPGSWPFVAGLAVLVVLTLVALTATRWRRRGADPLPATAEPRSSP